MKDNQKARRALEWDKKEVYEADAKLYMSKLRSTNKKFRKKRKRY